ncbi:hypothetical protein ACRYCC_42985 [Actinomadura scrupuli]|uniref:hypothetical protein n=1 Tax=Actinomadura scrupuli TaxID=559629 RepID=UPI003D9974E8
MAYQLAALRFRMVGEHSARFTDLPLDLTAPTDGGAAPQDSVVWLRNGGGKSSILSLTYALLLPHANDFMGKSVQRSLTDYVDTGDTSHVIAVWQPHETGRTLLGDAEDVLVTGVVHEWADLRRPANAAESRDKLNSTFYAFYALPGVLGLETLPFTDESGRPRRLNLFLEKLRELVRPHARHATLVATDKQHVWAKALLDRHLDPEIFRTQKQMNHVEGGVEDLFKFPAAKDFIDFLLDLATQPDAATSIANRLASVTALLAAKPHKIEERDFCGAAAHDLNEVAACHGHLQTAARELSAVTAAAETLAASFTCAVTAAEGLQRSLKKQLAAFVEARTAANTDRSTAGDLAYLYRREGARLRLGEAQAQEQQANQQVDDATGVVLAWETTLQLATVVELRSRLAQAQQAAAVEEEQLAPLRQEHARHATLLRRRLDTLAEEADFAAELADEQRETAEETLAHEEELEKRAHTDKATAAAEESRARTKLETLDERRRDGVTRGYLPTHSTPPRTHLDAVETERTRLERECDELTARAEVRQNRRTQITERDTVLASEHSTTDGTRTSTVTRRTDLGARLAELTGSERLRGLAETAVDESVDLWVEGPILLRRLSDAIIAADDERILRRAEQHADQRTIEAQERNQVLPSSLDAERIARELIDAGVPAQTGWSHLREVMPAHELLTALNISEIARLGCGVIVATSQVTDAVRLLDTRSAVTTSLVGVYSAHVAETLVRGLPETPSAAAAWTRLQPGLIDPDEAEAAIRLLKERAHAHILKDKDLARQRTADDELARQISQFLSDCPAGHLATLDQETERLDRRLQAITEEQADNRAELQGLSDADRLDTARRDTLSGDLRRIDAAVNWLEELIPALAAEQTWHDRLEDARKRGDDADQRAQTHNRNARQALITAQRCESAAGAERVRAAGYRSERDGLPETASSPIELSGDPSTPLDALRRRQQDALKALETRAAQSVLADRVQNLIQRVAEAEQELGQRAADDRAAASALLASPEGQEPHLRSAALSRARQDLAAATGKHGAARSRVQQRSSELEEVERLYRQPPRRTLPLIPTSSAEADALAAEQETRNQRAQERLTQAEAHIGSVEQETGRAENRKTLLGTLLEALPDPGQNTAEPFAGDEDTARTSARQARDAVTAATKALGLTETDLNVSVDRLRRTAARYAGISGPMKDRVANDPPALLGPHARELGDKLRLRAQTLDGELSSIAQDQAIISEALAHLVKESLDMLGKAERASHMKTASGSWADKKVLRISFDRPGDTDLVVYAERVIDRQVEKGLKPEGMPLLKAAVHEAAGPRGFTVKVLKPTEGTAATTEDISRLAKWSGGEKLTVCVALYCTLAALRAAHTGRKGHSGGVLLLDNPIGRASSASLVRLQRDVAASHGVQLIYTTGVKDPAAVVQFPNVIRLDNREGRTRSRRYIVAETRTDQASMDKTSIITGIRVAHTDHPWSDQDPAALHKDPG